MAFEFHYRRFVAWQDTDAAGIIHFTNYFRYMEEAETRFQLSLGSEFLEAVRQGIYCLRVAVSCDFLQPVTFGDEVDIHLWVRRKGRSSIGYEMSFRHNGEEVARGRLTAVCVSNDGGTMKSVPIPPALDRALEVAPFAEGSAGTEATANAKANKGSVA
jgi:YbgC/YbaW family acyl-CoA thioester hydrolase